MLLLFDTSTSHLAIGIADAAGTLLTEFHAEAGEGERGIHDARLATGTESLLREAEIAPKEISRIGLIIGPGSFTGLRIGLSFAKGFAFATGAALVPLTPHEVMVAEVGRTIDSLVVTPGYREDLFYAAESGTPQDVRPLSIEALSARRERPMILHDSLLGNSSDFLPRSAKFASVSLLIMARQTFECDAPLVAFEPLEPLYLT